MGIGKRSVTSRTFTLSKGGRVTSHHPQADGRGELLRLAEGSLALSVVRDHELRHRQIVSPAGSDVWRVRSPFC